MRITTTLLALSLALGAPALAAEGGAGGDHAEEHGEGGHGGEHHANYSGDADHDGTPNWLDADSEDYVVMDLVQHTFNFLVLAAVLVWGTRAPIQSFLRNRSDRIRAELEASTAAREAAQDRVDELNARLAGLEDELGQIRAESEASAQREVEAIHTAAREGAERIKVNAERTIQDEVARARTALRKDAVDLASQLAEATLRDRVTSDDHKRLASQFLDALNSEGA